MMTHTLQPCFDALYRPTFGLLSKVITWEEFRDKVFVTYINKEVNLSTMSPSAIQSFAQPLLDTFLDLPLYIRVLSIIIGFPTIAIALNVLSQVVCLHQALLRELLMYRHSHETLPFHPWYSTISPGSEVQPITVRTHTSSSLSVETRYVRSSGRLL